MQEKGLGFVVHFFLRLCYLASQRLTLFICEVERAASSLHSLVPRLCRVADLQAASTVSGAPGMRWVMFTGRVLMPVRMMKVPLWLRGAMPASAISRLSASCFRTEAITVLRG